MAKKALILGLALTLAAALMGPATARKKKRGPKPYTSETVTVMTSTVAGSFTFQEFDLTCDIPNSNGFDAYVWEAPRQYRDTFAIIEAIGDPSQFGLYNLDIYTFDKECNQLTEAWDVGTDQTGVLLPGTHYIMIHSNIGEPNVTFHYELKPTK